MPRRPRALEGNVVYHLYNRRNDKQCLFPSDESRDEFLGWLKTATEHHPVRLHAFCLMTTHWHLAASAVQPTALSRFVHWLSCKHAIRFRRDTATIGQGHVYQDRFQAVPVVGVVHYVTLIRYIEANPVNGGVVQRAEDWRWSSLKERCRSDQSVITPGPWALPANWLEIVNTPDLRIELLPDLLGQTAAFRPDPISFH